MSQMAVDVRCPVDPRHLFMKLVTDGERPVVVQPGNLMEFFCKVCTRNAREMDHSVRRVLHRFDLAGSLVESLTVR